MHEHTYLFTISLLQALETEANIALCLADEKTKVVLAGDHMQVHIIYGRVYMFIHLSY